MMMMEIKIAGKTNLATIKVPNGYLVNYSTCTINKTLLIATSLKTILNFEW